MPKKSIRKNKKRKEKTRKKRGGNIEERFVYRLIEPLVLGLQDQIDELGVRADAIENDRDALEERIEALERQRSGTGGTGGGKRNKKTRKKRGGNTEEVNRQLRLLVNQVLANNTQIQELEQWQEAYEDLNLEERIEALERQRSGTGGTGGGKRKKKTRKKRGAVKFGKNKTTAEIVKEGRKILQTTPQKKKRQIREQQIKLTGEQEFSLFKKQALDKMKIAFYKSFKKLPSDIDRKILSLVYKSLKQPLSAQENQIMRNYRAENNENKRKLVWMNNALRQLRQKSEIVKHKIYNTGDDPDALMKYKPRKKKPIKGPATDLVVDTDKYMSPVKGPDTRYPKLSLDIGERTNKKLFNGGRRKKRRTRKKNRG